MTDEKLSFIEARFKKEKSDFYLHTFAKDLSAVIFMNKGKESHREFGQILIYNELIEYRLCLSISNFPTPIAEIFYRIRYNDNFFIPHSIESLVLFLYNKNPEFKFC